MKRICTFLVSTLLLAGCGNGTNPFMQNGGTAYQPTATPTATNVPDALAKNLKSASYDPLTQTLTLDLRSLDGGTEFATYARTPGLDVAGYQAYTIQQDWSHRHFTALVGESGDPAKSVRAGVVGDGGQYNRYWSGGFYERDGGFTPPAGSGLVTYDGSYAGVTNIDGPGAVLAAPPAGAEASTLPAQSARTDGLIRLTVDFTNNAVNGSVYDRKFTDTAQALPTIVLVEGVIDATGAYAGKVEYDGEIDTNIGDFGGIFGGADAGGTGGVVALGEFDGVGDPLGYENEAEIGVFVLTKCGLPGAAPTCP